MHRRSTLFLAAFTLGAVVLAANFSTQAGDLLQGRIKRATWTTLSSVLETNSSDSANLRGLVDGWNSTSEVEQTFALWDDANQDIYVSSYSETSSPTLSLLGTAVNSQTRAASYGASLTSINGTPYVGYIETTTPAQMTVKEWDGSTWTSVGGTPLVVDPTASAYLPLVANDGTNLYAVWEEVSTSNGSRAFYIDYWDGSVWNSLGSLAAFGVDNIYSIAADSSSDVYIAAMENSTGTRQISVLHWDGSTWTNTGSFSGINNDPELKMALPSPGSASPSVYMLYSNGLMNLSAWDGSTWTLLSSGFNSATKAAYSGSLEITTPKTIWATWEEYTSGKGNPIHTVRTARSKDGGLTWTLIPSVLNLDPAHSAGSPQIARGLGSLVYIAWIELNSSKNYDIVFGSYQP